ncbi:hypothetical protein NIE88_04445 [Sporolactobacillus shoreicorticis]|uniref:Flagellar protein FliT n=1 Tax=Sporolactobacillus shoreicorticis TaxID=1923877 RepID=A0ABW5RZ75_9BACL|nr:hypothetical protein [Sporolactobacillus shoreicorticis]MCO7125023.1 hypothetical protein [Sporolactobacillus shoreicorticis]
MSVEKLYQVTKEIQKLVKQQSENPKNDFTKEINDKLELRQKLIDQLPKAFSKDEKKIGEKIIEANNEIHSLMQVARRNLVGEMQQFKHKKESLKTYRGYKNPLINQSSAYFDRHE